MDIDPAAVETFESPKDLGDWLAENFDSKQELWVKVYKKQSGITSVSWDDCVIQALAWGWIDGIKKSNDDLSWFQRLTPRRAKSAWSKKNCGHVDRLIAAGLMKASGQKQVDAAKKDGRWEAAYAGSADFEIPRDLLDYLDQDTDAKAGFDALKRCDLFTIYHQLHSAKRAATRAGRMEKIIATLRKGEKFH